MERDRNPGITGQIFVPFGAHGFWLQINPQWLPPPERSRFVISNSFYYHEVVEANSIDEAITKALEMAPEYFKRLEQAVEKAKKR